MANKNKAGANKAPSANTRAPGANKPAANKTPSAGSRAPGASKPAANKAPSAGTRSTGNKNNNNKNNNNKGNNNKGNTKDTGKAFLDTFLSDLQKKGGLNIVTSPTQSNAIESYITGQQQAWADKYAADREATEIGIAQADNQTKISLGQMNLQGVQAQAEAQKFAATEAARGSIETQRVASESQERQIGLEGKETRETNLQSELFRRYKEAKDQGDALRAFRA